MMLRMFKGLVPVSILFIFSGLAFGFGGYGNTLNNSGVCDPPPYSGDCNLCHVPPSRSTSSDAKDAFNSGDYAFFCPTVDPNTTDDDGDGLSENQGDCNDNDPLIFPGATEICGDGIDQDCNGSDLACQPNPNDVDDDGDGMTENQGDCNDNDASIFLGATEICGDGIDQDCNGSDLICQPTPTCTDEDNDGFNAATAGLDCGPLDCNDNDPAINPGAAERCSDGIDNNCDGLTDGQDVGACPAPSTCTDADQDGFFAQTGCNTVQDCADNDALTFPGATELCGDGIDNDCDGMTDENCDTGSDDGVTLYENNCASCHSAFPNSDVCGEDAEDIMEAIADNEGGMGFLSSLSDTQIRAIAEELANCNKDDDESYDKDEEDDEDKRERHDRDDHRNRNDRNDRDDRHDRRDQHERD